MATYKLTQTFSDNTTKDINFTIPETAGTYKLKFTLSDSTVIDAGNVVVGTTPSTYKINLAMTDGSNMSANILVPSIGYKVTIPAMEVGISALQYRYTNTSGGTSFVNASASSTTTVMVQPNTSIQVYAHTLSDTANYQAWTGNTTTWTVTSDDMSLSKFYAQYKHAPTIISTSATSNSVTCKIKNESTISAGVMLLKSTSTTGQYSPAINRPIQINGSSSISITTTDLSPSTTYYWMAILVDMNGHIQSSPESAVIAQATKAAGWTVTIPARQTGISTLQYRYTNLSSSTAYVSAGTSQTSVQVKSGTSITVYSSTVSDTTNFQKWSGNITSWTINADTTLPVYYAQFKTSPTITNASSTASSVSCTVKNNLNMAVYGMLYKSTSLNGTYTAAASGVLINANSSTTIKVSGLTSNTTYYWKVKYAVPNGSIKEGPLSSVTTKATLPAYVAVEIPVKQSGVNSIKYQYTNSSGNLANIYAGTSVKTINVKTNTFVTVAAQSFTSNDYQSWTGNITSWEITGSISLPPYYAQLKGTPTFSSYSRTTSSITVYWKNTLSSGYYIRASLYNGNSQVDYFDHYVEAGATSSAIKFTGLIRGKTYTAKAQYVSTDGNIKSGELATRSVSTSS